MAMNYTTLTGSKTTTGSILSFVKYTKVPPTVVLDEAQALIYSLLRVREMRASAVVTLASGDSSAALPTGYLDPIAMRDREGWETIPDRYVSEAFILGQRTYTNDVLDSGTPMEVAVFDEAFQFGCKADAQRKYDLVFFKTPDLLASSSNETNFLTTRYPYLLRTGCLAGAALYMKDMEEYNARFSDLVKFIQAANAESDLSRAS